MDFLSETKTIQLLKRKLPQIFSFPVNLPKFGGEHIEWSAETTRIMNLMPGQGIFHTGIESSDPFAEGVRRNQLKEAHDFYTNFEQRLERIAGLGIKWLRFGVPYSTAHLGPGQYDFDFFEKVLRKCEQLGITILADLLHFGLPEWLHAEDTLRPFFQNPKFPEHFADYVESFAKRFPEIKFYTLVNEPFVTANFSAKMGVWNEAKPNPDWHDDREFVQAIANIAKAAILARERLEQVWFSERRTDKGQELIFIQNESFEAAVASPGSHREEEAYQFNLRRFAALDLIFGKRDLGMKRYLLSQGMTPADYEWFMLNGQTSKTILGIDHYPWCVYYLDREGQEIEPLERYQLYELSKVYYDRYRMPLLHTEINGLPELAVSLCDKTYDALVRLRNEGYPVCGMGWYGDEYQVGWQNVMIGDTRHSEYPVGLFYKGELQPVASLFNELASKGLTVSKQPGIVSKLRRIFHI